MDINELRQLKQDVISGDKKIYSNLNVTESFINNRVETIIELEEISAYISLKNDKTKHQIDLIKNDTLPLSLKTYRFLNPYVGALMLTKSGENYFISFCCRDAKNNDQHAEYTLLNDILKDYIFSNEDILFTTLEPCTNNSRKSWSTSCSDLIRMKNIRNVHIGSLDSNPLITGQGIKSLLDSQITVFFYDIRIREFISNNNEVFLRQFDLPKGDPQKYKDIFDSFDSYLDYDTVEKYISLTISGIDSIDHFDLYEKKNCGEKYRNIFEFFREMVMNRSILLADREINKFVCTNDFALFFFNEPKKIVDGATIRIICKDGGKTEDCSLYQAFIRIVDKMDGFYVVEKGKKINKGKKLNHEDEIFKVVEDRFNSSVARSLIEYESIIRELLVNSIVHRDYDSPVFTEVILEDDYIEVKNPISAETMKYFEKIKNYSYGSRPTNARLMRFFMDMKFCERKSHGMRLAEKYRIKYSLDNWILTARFEKHEQ